MKHILRKIMDMADARRSKEDPFAWSERETKAFRTLSSMSEWRIYAELLDKCCTLYAEEAMSANAQNRDYVAGFASGIRRAGTLVDEILQQRELDERHKRDEGKRDRERAKNRKLQHFGSRFYPVSGNGIGEKRDR